MGTSGELPVGTVTFLFTDIEGSTQLLKQLGGDRYGEALADHQLILRETFAEHGGHEIDTQGDSFFVAFRRAKDAVAAAIGCQGGLADHVWPDDTDLRARMGIHTGEPAAAGERYVGMGVHRAARICAAGHGGQVLISQTTRELLRDDPIPDVSLRDLGEHQLKDMDEPERLYQVVAPGLVPDFPALKTAAPAPFEGREGELAEVAAEQMARSWRRPGRRVLIGATFAAALVGAALGVLLTQGGGSSADAAVAANAVGLIDSESGNVTSEVPVGESPGAIASGEGAIWVTSTGGNSVSRIDPLTSEVRQTIPVGGGPSGITAGAGAVWVANGLDGTVTRIDSTTSQPVQTTTVGNGPSGVAFGESAVWVTNSADGTVSKIDPDSGRASKPVPAVSGASGIAVGFDRVWVASPSTGKVVVLDPRSGVVLHEIAVGVEPNAVAVGAAAVWVSNRADGTISKIDPRTYSVKDVIPVGRGPDSIAAGTGGVWVANGGEGTLVRVDPASGEIAKTVALDNPPRAVALSPQGVYVAVGSTGVEHRGGAARVVTWFEADFIDPALAYDATSWSALTMTNDGLVTFRKVGGVQGAQLAPDLAVSLPTPTDSGKTYTFQMRRGIRYSNGKLVQPDDVKWAVERLFELASPGAGYYGGIVGADRCAKGKHCDLSRGIVTDRVARTVTVHLSAPDAEFLNKLALPFAFAVPVGTPARDVGRHPVPATGPYRIAEFGEKTKRIRLVRNPSFREWSGDAQPQGYPDAISLSWRYGLDATKRMRAVERGATDISVGAGGPPLSKREIDRLAVRYPSQLHLNTQFTTFWFFLNTRVAPFDDVRLRRAVNLAFDRAEFARLLGQAHASTCQILPPNFPGYRPTCLYGGGGLAGVEAARRLVRSAGAAGADVTVWVMSPRAEEGRYMLSVLDSIGFRTRLNVREPATYFSKVYDSRTRAQMGVTGWTADFPSAAGFIPSAFSCAAFVPASPAKNANPSEFCDPAIDAKMVLAVAAQVQDPASASTRWQEVERSLLAQAPVVPTYNQRSVDFVAKRVGNYQYNPQWGALVDQLWLK